MSLRRPHGTLGGPDLLAIPNQDVPRDYEGLFDEREPDTRKQYENAPFG
jgi:hypothetical protein